MEKFDEERRDQGGQLEPGEPDELSASEQASASSADANEADDEIILAPLDDDDVADDERADQENDTTSALSDNSAISAELTQTDVYVDPDTGEEEVDPLLQENVGVEDDVADLLDGTGLQVLSVTDGIVELSGTMATQEDLADVVREIMGLDEVLEVDTTDVD